jgi:hypothetical protein
MHEMSRKFQKAARKIAEYKRNDVRFEILPNRGWLLKMMGDSEFVPAIGMVDDNLIGSQDDVDTFAALLGFEFQVERVLFDAEKAGFRLNAGWAAKYWEMPGEMPNEHQSFPVDAIVDAAQTKMAASLMALMGIVDRYRMKRFKDRVKRLMP